MPGWRDGREVDIDAMCAAIVERFPPLAGAPVRPIGRGWDNVVVQIGGLYVRLAIRDVAEPLMRMEWGLLPRLVELGFRTPTLVAHGEAAPGLPGPWMVVDPVPGQELAVILARGRALADPASLGRGLRSLHDPARLVGLPADSPRSARDRILPKALADRVRKYQELALNHGLDVPTQALERLLGDTDRGLTPLPDALVHGDLHLRHIIVDESGCFVGLIDWGDAGVGPPVADLGVVYWGLLPEQRAAFLDAYRGVDDATLASARRFAAFSCLALWVSGSDLGQTTVVAAAREGLRRVLLEPA